MHLRVYFARDALSCALVFLANVRHDRERPMPPARYDVVLSLGANLGSREALLRAGIELLARTVAVTARAPVWETPPMGPPQPAYLNTAVRVATDLPPQDLLARTQHVERLLGRERRVRWGARTLDIDIAWIDGIAVRLDGLTVPHAGLRERDFMRVPLLAVAPDARDPGTGEAYASLGPTEVAGSAARAWGDPRGFDVDDVRAARLEGALRDAGAACERVAWFDDEAGAVSGARALRVARVVIGEGGRVGLVGEHRRAE